MILLRHEILLSTIYVVADCTALYIALDFNNGISRVGYWLTSKSQEYQDQELYPGWGSMLWLSMYYNYSTMYKYIGNISMQSRHTNEQQQRTTWVSFYLYTVKLKFDFGIKISLRLLTTLKQRSIFHHDTFIWCQIFTCFKARMHFF